MPFIKNKAKKNYESVSRN